MEDNSNNENENLNSHNNRYEKSVTELAEEKELKIKWHKEILENASMQEHFKSFHPASIDSFISYYLIEKYFAYKYADSYEQRVEEKRSRWIDEAHEHLKTIQNKKLFDLQCLWRAEQLTLEGVQIGYDFEVWEKDILNCPFLEPVTKADIQMYQDFLLTSDVDFLNISNQYELQNYEQIKEGYNAESDIDPMPDWYEYHNVRTGNSSLLLLPDTRGEKEEFYATLFRKDRDKDLPPRAPYVPEERPYLTTYDLEKVLFFVNTFEDEETRKKYANYSELNKKQQLENFDLNILLSDMEAEEEYIPIEAHYDFREALIKAYNHFKLKKLAEHMPLAHEQYLFNQKMGFTIAPEDNFYMGIRDKYLEMILKGRELNGEDRDLAF